MIPYGNILHSASPESYCKREKSGLIRKRKAASAFFVVRKDDNICLPYKVTKWLNLG